MKLPVYPEYAATRDAWVGTAPSHWKFLRADFTTVSNKEQISDVAMEGIEVLHYSIPNVQEFGIAQIEDGNEIDSAKLRITTPQLLISKLNPRKATLCIAAPDEKLLTVCSGEFVPIIPEGDLTLRYCYYTWISDKVTKLLSSRVQSVTRSHQRVSPEDITKLPWAWPPKDEQQQIAAFLDWKTGQIDALIARKQELLEKLKEKRLAVITQAVTRGLNPAAPLRDSGIPWLGQVPEHWEVKKFSYFSRVVRGASPRPAGDPTFFNGDYIPWITVGEITKDEHIHLESTETMLTEEGAQNSRTMTAGTLVVTNSGATLGVPKILSITGCANDGVVSFEDLADDVDKVFIYFFLRSQTEELRERMKQGGGQPNLNTDIIKALAVPFPPLQEQTAIAKHLCDATGKLDKMTAKVAEAIGRLTEYRTALITAATTGKIDVRKVTST